MKKALEKCTPGCSTYLAHIKALADLDAAERAEEVKLGLTPSNLGAAVKDEFLFISHVHVVPRNRQELEKLLKEQAIKACEGLHYSEQDEAIRKQLAEDFPDGTQERSDSNGSKEHAQS
jgi:hypothetical protein